MTCFGYKGMTPQKLLPELGPQAYPHPRTEVLVNGFKTELDTRMADIKNARVELERLFAMRIPDSAIDAPENSKFKEDCMKAIRCSEAAFTSYAGSVRSIKTVLETCYLKIQQPFKFDDHNNIYDICYLDLNNINDVIYYI